MALLILLGVPLVASLALAFIGDRKLAPEVNILGSAATFVASVKLALQVYEHGLDPGGEQLLLCRRLQRLPDGPHRPSFP